MTKTPQNRLCIFNPFPTQRVTTTQNCGSLDHTPSGPLHVKRSAEDDRASRSLSADDWRAGMGMTDVWRWRDRSSFCQRASLIPFRLVPAPVVCKIMIFYHVKLGHKALLCVDDSVCPLVCFVRIWLCVVDWTLDPITKQLSVRVCRRPLSLNKTYWYLAVGNKLTLYGALFIDFAEAFDVISHDLLLKQMTLYALTHLFHQTILDWPPLSSLG